MGGDLLQRNYRNARNAGVKCFTFVGIKDL
jgi:hypothetical protein